MSVLAGAVGRVEPAGSGFELGFIDAAASAGVLVVVDDQALTWVMSLGWSGTLTERYSV
jgi:hypothetical protein